MKRKALFFILISFQFFAYETGAKNSTLIEAYLESMFSSRYLDAKSILQKLDSEKKNEIETKVAYANFWMVMYDTSGQKEKYHTICRQYATEAINLIQSKQEKTYDDVFHLISAKSILLKIQVSKKKLLKAAKDLKDIIQYFEFALENDHNYKMKLIAGMYNFHIENAKEDYPVIYPIAIFYPAGNKVKGVQQIKDCTKVNDKSIRIRSYLYLTKIYQNDIKNINISSYYYKKLLSLYPSNLVWRCQYIKALRQYEKYKEAEKEKQVLLQFIKTNKQITEEQKIFFKEV